MFMRSVFSVISLGGSTKTRTSFVCNHIRKGSHYTKIMANNCDFDPTIFADKYNRQEEAAELHLNGKISLSELSAQLENALHGKRKLLRREFTNDICHLEDGMQGKLDKANDKKRCFRVMQWNILAQSLSSGKDNFIRCPPEALTWEYRRLRMLEEIVNIDPDILCLQEVDHFGFFSPILEKIGYRGSFFPKPDSPCLFTPDTNGPDGCALFYKREKFSILGSESIVLHQDKLDILTNQVCIIYNLRLKSDPDLDVTVATTHLKAKPGWHDLRASQGNYLIKYLRKRVGQKPLIVCGDFNAEPTEPVYKIFASHPMNLGSAYTLLNHPNHEEPAYTTWKIRGGRHGEELDVCHTIDYMWYTMPALGVTSLLALPTEEDLGADRLPNFHYPSDHLSLAADFVFL